MLITLVIIETIIIIFAFIAFIVMGNKIKKDSKTIKRLKIPYDDYSRYQKGYVEFYKYLNSIIEKSVNPLSSYYLLIKINLLEYFKDNIE